MYAISVGAAAKETKLAAKVRKTAAAVGKTVAGDFVETACLPRLLVARPDYPAVSCLRLFQRLQSAAFREKPVCAEMT